MASEPITRSRQSRLAAERALVLVALNYGATPPFVLLGGLVPDLLCPKAPIAHAGTTDIDVQLDIEIATDGVNAPVLEQSLLQSGFMPSDENIWRWQMRSDEGTVTVIKFELFADRADVAQGSVIGFDACQRLGAVNLRGTGWVARDFEARVLHSIIGNAPKQATINVAGLGGFLVAKMFAARTRRAPKDWYDIAYVLQHNQAGGPLEAAAAVKTLIRAESAAEIELLLTDLNANFAATSSQGTSAYAAQIYADDPDINEPQARLDAQLTVQAFVDAVKSTTTT